LTEFEEDTSLYHDNYDDPEVSVLYGDELITNHSLKKSKLLYVNYAKTAKRVDVKKLKDNLWKALTLAKPPSTQQQDQCDTEDDEEGKVYGVQKFTVIVQNLKKMYPPKTMRDISVPFCFICLLHLANEKDLSIMGVENNNEEDDDFVLGESSAAGGDWMRNEAILNEVTIVQNTV
jgi:condensin complex subunit 2